MLLATVLLAHALLLGAVPMGWGEGTAGGVKRPLQVRQIVLPAAPEPAAPEPPAVAPVAAPAPPAPPIPAVLAALPLPAAPLAASAPEPAAPAAEPVPAVAAAPEPAPAAAAEDGGAAPPVYATRLPAPVVLYYDLRHGALRGSGELAWRPAGGRYELTMIGTVFSVAVLNWVSQGGIDAAGIAPERFVDRRRGRDLRAANFQRDKHLITFSGPQVEYPLWPGAQDRLSWMLQLAAIVDAEPATFGLGARISLFVVGARGDGDIWTFTVEGTEALELPGGPVAAALRLRREPRKPFDTLGEIWLDPARSHLPVRVRLSVAQTDDSTEFLLRSTSP